MTTGQLWTHTILPLLVLVSAWLAPSLSRPTLPFGVQVPASRAGAPVIAEQRRAYRWWVGVGGGVLVLAGLALSAAVAHPVLATAVPIGSVLVCLTGYLRARRAIRAVKQREDWYHGLRQAAVTDTSLRTRPERFPWPWAVPALLVPGFTAALGVARYPSMPDRLPMHFAGAGTVDRYAAKSVTTAFSPVLAQAAVTALVLVLLWFSFRARADLDPARPNVTASQHRRFVVRTTISVLLLVACVNVTLLLAASRIWQGARTVSPVVLLLPVVVGFAIVIGVAIRTGQNGSRLPAEDRATDAPGTAPEPDTGLVHRDDDRYWRGAGTLYVNRQDPALFVPKRLGVGWTVNFGNPRVLLPVLLVAAFCVVMSLLGR